LGRQVRVVLSPTKTRGKYGRLLAYVYLVPSEVMFNELLIEHGYAYADWRFAHPHKRRFKTIEKRAAKKGAGLWAEVTFEQKPEWRQRMERLGS
jgi:endonuclease YncB( thermonuclease family)